MKNLGRFLGLLPLFVMSLLMLSGCGQVTGPISPLVNPPVQYGFDNGTASLVGWALNSTSPLGGSVTLSIESQTVFQGTGALEIQLPAPLNNANIGVTLPVATDFTGKFLSIWIYWQSGLVSPPYNVGAQIYLTDAAYGWTSGGWTNLGSGRWQQIVCNASGAAGSANLKAITTIGFQVGGANNAVFSSPGVVYADSFAY
jgi:hypothetical protein